MSPSLPSSYKAAVFESKGAPLVLKDVELKHPGPKEVLVRINACGVCHSDIFIGDGHLGDVFPLIPGHEFIGDVAAVGEGVTRVSIGDRVGGQWHGGHDASCRQCARGLMQNCENKIVNGLTRDGGYAEYATIREEAASRIPKDVDPAEAAPLLCAGVTVFNGIRKMGLEQGNIVAVQGIGGLGHLAVQFATKMGYHTVAISSGESKRDFAHQLGAHTYIDASKEDAMAKLQEMGGAALIVSTVPSPSAISPLVGGLQPGGKLLVLAPVGPVEFDTSPLVVEGISIHGWPSGHALDTEETIKFAQMYGVKSIIEKFSLEDAQKALDHCRSGKVRFRGVIVI